MNVYNVKATVITPVSIGNGNQLSPYKDYFIKDGLIHYIYTEKLGIHLVKNEELMDEYVEGVANMNGNRSKFDLLQFIEDKLDLRSSEITRNTLYFYGDPSSKLPINAFIKSPNHQPYIPGSSLKGAIKTALVYTDLEKTPKGENWRKHFFEQLSQINFRDKRDMWKLDALTQDLEKLLKEKAEIQKKGVTERMIITDSKLLQRDALEVVDLKRTQIPVRQEVLRKQSRFDFTLSFPDETWISFGEKMNRFAFNNLSAAGKENEDLFHQVENAFNNNHSTIFIALGFGKGIYLNSILLSLKDYAYNHGKERLFENYLRYLSPKTRKIHIDTFPNTEFKTWQNQSSLGWIKLENTHF